MPLLGKNLMKIFLFFFLLKHGPSRLFFSGFFCGFERCGSPASPRRRVEASAAFPNFSRLRARQDFHAHTLCAHEESNLDYGIRNPAFCPLNYGRPTTLQFISELRRASILQSQRPRDLVGCGLFMLLFGKKLQEQCADVVRRHKC